MQSRSLHTFRKSAAKPSPRMMEMKMLPILVFNMRLILIPILVQLDGMGTRGMLYCTQKISRETYGVGKPMV